MTGQLETPREGLMSTTTSLPSVMKPRYINPVGKSQTQEGDACELRESSGQFIGRLVQCFALPAATRNLHTTQPSTLLPTYDEVVNLTGLL
jgi:hypothetical protein